MTMMNKTTRIPPKPLHRNTTTKATMLEEETHTTLEETHRAMDLANRKQEQTQRKLEESKKLVR